MWIIFNHCRLLSQTSPVQFKSTDKTVCEWCSNDPNSPLAVYSLVLFTFTVVFNMVASVLKYEDFTL
jgi:hypothetical protein